MIYFQLTVFLAVFSSVQLRNSYHNSDSYSDDKSSDSGSIIGSIDAGTGGGYLLVSVPSEFQDCMQKGNSSYDNNELKIWCLRCVLWNHKSVEEENIPKPNDDKADERKRKWYKHGRKRRAAEASFLDKYRNKDNEKIPLYGPSVRKECRALSKDELLRLNQAFRALYDTGIIDKFTEMHVNASTFVHNGASFLPWHRAYLAYFEQALKSIDSSVSLCYWDSTIETNQETFVANAKATSILFSPKYFGTSSSTVDMGPYAGWTWHGLPLQRDDNFGGAPISNDELAIIPYYGICSFGDFTGAIEYFHNNVHRLIGGDMATFHAACDPIFYFHHAFTDLIWEDFRTRQQTGECGIDPTTDYPYKPDDCFERHCLYDSMKGMEFLETVDGLAEYWTDNFVTYQARPNCSNKCGGSDDLFCYNGSYVLPRMNPEYEAFETTSDESTSNKTKRDTNGRQSSLDRNCEIAAEIVRGQIRASESVENLKEHLEKKMKEIKKIPPRRNYEQFFKANPVDEERIIRSRETVLYDLMMAKEKGYPFKSKK